MFDRAGNEILPLREMLEQERQKREELERRVAELEQKLQQQTLK
jgi:BMFP domain-containing protein YqiC